MVILLHPHFVEEPLRFREVDGLPKVTQPGSGGVRSHLAPKGATLPLNPAALLSAETGKGLRGLRAQGQIVKVEQARQSQVVPIRPKLLQERVKAPGSESRAPAGAVGH